MKLGLYGGTFDPIHKGHIYVATEVLRLLNLDELIFIPNSQPPHKIMRSYLPYHQRFEMIELAIDGYEKFRVSDIEASNKAHYTVNTLKALKRLYPNDEFYFIIGEDSLRDLDTWKNPQDIGRYANLVVFSRVDKRFDDNLSLEQLSEIYRRRYQLNIIALNVLPVKMASKDIRWKIIKGENIEEMVPKGVKEYIEENELYNH